MYNICSKLDNDILSINISGRIDSENAPKVEREILEITSANAFKSIVMDFDGLEAISSAGLRIMLLLKKKYDDFKIINASGAVYDVFDITGFSSIINIKRAFRNLSIEGCDVLGEGAKGIVYRYNDDIIVKVYKAANCLDELNSNCELAHKAFLMGIPTAISYDIVKVGELFGLVYELVNTKSLSELIASNPDQFNYYVEVFSDLLKELEKVPVNDGDLTSIKDRILGWAKMASKFLTSEENEKVLRLINSTPDSHTVIHGDFHTNNIVIQNGEPLLLDLDTLAYGNPVFELANIFFSFVGYNSIYPNGNEIFLGIDSDTCQKFYESFISLHFKDAENIDEITNAIEFVGYLRAMNHIGKREKDQGKIDLCVKLLRESLSKVESIAI